jgi:hypothetical protein
MRAPDRTFALGAVIPAKAGTHFDFGFRTGRKMDSGFRRNDEVAFGQSN